MRIVLILFAFLFMSGPLPAQPASQAAAPDQQGEQVQSDETSEKPAVSTPPPALPGAWERVMENPSRLSPFPRSSPAETLLSFLAAGKRLEETYSDYLENKDQSKLRELLRELHSMRQLMDLSQFPPAIQSKMNYATIGYLYDILARLPPLPRNSIPGDIPGESSLPDRWTIPGTDIQIARIESGPRTGDYLITGESIANMQEYYFRIIDQPVLNERLFPYLHREQMNATGHLIPDSAVRFLSHYMGGYYLNTPLWKIVATAIMIFSAVLASLIWFRLAWTRASEAGKAAPLARRAWQLLIPLGIYFIIWASQWFVIKQINPTGMFAAGEGLITTVILYVLGAWAAWLACYLIANAILLLPHLQTNGNDNTLVRLAGRVCAFMAASIILAYGANEVGIPALGLVAGLGVGGVAIALASQSTVENLFGGVSLFADRPLRIGDTIQFGDDSASVENIGPRSTRLRARSGALYTVPNADMAKMHIVNYTLRSNFFLKQILPVRGDTSPEQLIDLQQQLTTMLRDEERVEVKDGWPRAHVISVGPGRINIEIRAVVLTTEFTAFLETQESTLVKTLQLMRDRGIELAPPMAELKMG